MNFLRPIDRDVVVNGLRLHLLDWGGAGRTGLMTKGTGDDKRHTV